MLSGTHLHLSLPSALFRVASFFYPKMATASLASPLHFRAQLEMQRLLFMGSEAHPGVYVSFSRMGDTAFLRCKESGR